MKKRSVGKIQLIIGIIVFLLSITGFILSANLFNNIKNLNQESSGEGLGTFPVSDYEDKDALSSFYTNILLSTFLFSLLFFILSLLFVTEGISKF